EMLQIALLRNAYISGRISVADLLDRVLARIAEWNDPALWISRTSEIAVRNRGRELDAMAVSDPALIESLPLFGVPFAVKDNIDVAGMPTTAACPAFAYTPAATSPVVARLLEAGAVLLGKTNLDQFATGLAGTRSPYGVPRNPFDARFIPGGSSSGSAVAVAAGLVSFALGTDTAGSGRVPAAFNNIVGLKPTRGILSTHGVVPACRSLDCVSIFCLTAEDAETVLSIAAEYDRNDPYSRPLPPGKAAASTYRIGIPTPQDLGQVEGGYLTLFVQAVERLTSLGHTLIEIDIKPFLKTAQLLYGGPWVSERFAAVGQFVKEHSEAVHPVVRDIILGGEKYSAVDAFNGQYDLERFRQETSDTWKVADFLLLPTAPDIYRIAEIESDPIALNSRLGLFTNFLNLLDLAAVAVPAG